MTRLVCIASLLLLVAAGCGGAARRHTAAQPRLPRALAAAWAGRADEVAAAVASGDGCRARDLAASLRDDVVAQEDEVPLRLRATLVRSVGALAGRIACLPPSHPPHPHPPPHQKPPKPPKHGGDQGDHG